MLEKKTTRNKTGPINPCPKKKTPEEHNGLCRLQAPLSCQSAIEVFKVLGLWVFRSLFRSFGCLGFQFLVIYLLLFGFVGC